MSWKERQMSKGCHDAHTLILSLVNAHRQEVLKQRCYFNAQCLQPNSLMSSHHESKGQSQDSSTEGALLRALSLSTLFIQVNS